MSLFPPSPPHKASLPGAGAWMQAGAAAIQCACMPQGVVPVAVQRPGPGALPHPAA